VTEFFTHPTAVVDEGARIGAGCKIWHFSHVMAGAILGADVVLGQNCFVGPGVLVKAFCRVQNNVSLYDGVTLDQGVFVGPSVVFTNVINPRACFPRKNEFQKTIVGEGASLGANSTIVCGLSIGACAMVGAGAVVTKDVAAYSLVCGVPAKPLGWVCRCGEKLNITNNNASCVACQRAYRMEENGLLEIKP